MKEKFKAFLKKRGYTIKKSKPRPDFSGERFTPAERKFSGKTIYIHDIPAFESDRHIFGFLQLLFNENLLNRNNYVFSATKIMHLFPVKVLFLQ